MRKKTYKAPTLRSQQIVLGVYGDYGDGGGGNEPSPRIVGGFELHMD